MESIEYLRKKLYEVIDSGTQEDILKVSQEMDELILNFMSEPKNQNSINN